MLADVAVSMDMVIFGWKYTAFNFCSQLAKLHGCVSYTSNIDHDWSHCVTGEVLGEPHQLNTVHTSTTNSDTVG